jgi:hypothetical protein
MTTLLIPLLLAAAAPALPADDAAARAREVRTLEAVTIEGEAAVPQVLFITSRDHPRHREDLGRAYRRTALDVARAVRLPHRLIIHHDCVTADPKEQQP